MGGSALTRMEAGTVAGVRPLRPAPSAEVFHLPVAGSNGCSDVPLVRGLDRYRIHVGDLIVDLRNAPRRKVSELFVPRGRALLLVALAGTVEIGSGEATITCAPSTPWLCGVSGRVVLNGLDCTNVLAIHFHRDRLNAQVSALTGDGRRLALAETLLSPVSDSRRMQRVTDLMMGLFKRGRTVQDAATSVAAASFYRGLAEHIADGAALEIMQPVRAVSDAMRLVRENHCIGFDLEQLAAVVGVTGGTLRKGFRTCLGMTVKEYIRSVRLAWARERLETGMESRSIADLAVAAGFADTPSFSRAYLRRYCESASQTRARAVRQRG
jgi:AraC-like DNA-binding protein